MGHPKGHHKDDYEPAIFPFTVTGSNYEQMWGHSFMGSFTDWMITAIAIIMLTKNGWGVLKQGSLETGGRFSAFFILFVGLQMFFGGTSHYLMDLAYEDGGEMGFAWGGEGTAWMIWWVPAVIFALLAPAALVVAALSHSGCESAGKVFGGIMAAVAAYAAFVMTGDARVEGKSQWGTLDLIAMAFNVLGGLVGTIAGIIGKKVFFAAGCGAFLVTWVFVILTPGSCKDPETLVTDCPYLPEFNHNCIFHVGYMVAVVLLGLEPIGQKLPEGAEPLQDVA
jgi:hypothetical protein